MDLFSGTENGKLQFGGLESAERGVDTERIIATRYTMLKLFFRKNQLSTRVIIRENASYWFT